MLNAGLEEIYTLFKIRIYFKSLGTSVFRTLYVVANFVEMFLFFATVHITNKRDISKKQLIVNIRDSLFNEKIFLVI